MVMTIHENPEEQPDPVYHPTQSDSEDDSELDDPADVTAPELPQPEQTTREEMAKDGTVWSDFVPGAATGRTPERNIFTDKPGPTAYAKRRIDDHLSSFLCLLDMEMLKDIRDCTVKMARTEENNEDWDLSLAELKAFISVFFLRAMYTKDFPLHQLWSTQCGNGYVKETMARDRFKSIMRYLRFDDKDTRPARKEQDKFAAMTDVWDRFIENCKICYVPGVNITVDEQLFPTKARCGFTQYMANKPDKFGIKFWIAADLETKYLLNGFPYLGKGPRRT